MVAVAFAWPLWKSNLATMIKNHNISAPFDPAIPLLGIYPAAVIKKTTKAMCKKLVTAVTFIIVRSRKPSKRPTTESWFGTLRVCRAIRLIMGAVR